MLSEDQVQVLTQLKLTRNQAKIYLTLAKSPPLNAIEISKTTNIPKEVIYRQMPKLLEKGLIEKIFETPSKFAAVPIKQALRSLLQQRSKETADVKTKTEQLICQFPSETEHVLSCPEPKIVLIPKGNRLLTFDRERLKMINESLDVVGSIKSLSDWVQTQPMLHKQLAARKVRIRAIVEETNNFEASQTNLKKHKILNNVDIGFSPSPLCTYLGIYDNKDVIVRLDTKADYPNSACLWTNNPCFVEMAKSHFEKLWSISMTAKAQQLTQ